jgi:hypothetical protein
MSMDTQASRRIGPELMDVRCRGFVHLMQGRNLIKLRSVQHDDLVIA